MSLEIFFYVSPGRRRKAVIAKSEDLPWMKLLSHESLAENMQIRRERVFLACAFLRRLFHFLFRRWVWQRLCPAAIFLIDQGKEVTP